MGVAVAAARICVLRRGSVLSVAPALLCLVDGVDDIRGVADADEREVVVAAAGGVVLSSPSPTAPDAKRIRNPRRVNPPST